MKQTTTLHVKPTKRASRILKKRYPRSDHAQAHNQVIENSNEYNLPLCIGVINCEKASDTVEHFAIFEALKKKTNVK